MFSYSSLINKGKVTLPSVDSWGSNLSIMRDPPKSITVRRIDKVGDNNDIVKMIDESDRCSDSVTRFARGVNPFVSVSYSNNGGQQSFLPYTINKDGDFHPPVPAPQDLLPLSRMPRNVTKIPSKPSIPHYLKELPNSREQNVQRTIKPEIISASVRASKTYSLQKPFQEGYTNGIQYNIENNNILTSADTSKSSYSDRTKLNGVAPVNSYLLEKLNASANTNKNNIKYVQYNNPKAKTNDILNVNVQTQKTGLTTQGSRIIHEPFELERKTPVLQAHTNLNSKLSNLKFIKNENDIFLMKNVPVYQTSTNSKGNEKIVYIHDNISLEKNLPEYQASTNISLKTQKRVQHDTMKEYNRKTVLMNQSTNISSKGDENVGSTVYNLEEKIQPGEFSIRPSIPVVDRLQGQNLRKKSDKENISKIAFESLQNKIITHRP
jgi:hypothetical protein